MPAGPVELVIVSDDGAVLTKGGTFEAPGDLDLRRHHELRSPCCYQRREHADRALAELNEWSWVAVRRCRVVELAEVTRG